MLYLSGRNSVANSKHAECPSTCRSKGAPSRMHLEQIRCQGQSWGPASFGHLPQAQLVLLFGSPTALRAPTPLDQLRAAYPRAVLLASSPAGELLRAALLDH